MAGNSTTTHYRLLEAGPLRGIVRAAAFLYGAAAGLRNLYYDLAPNASQRVKVPVICIGNLTTGGTGKTPMTALLARYFAQRGMKPAILSRGYGRRRPRHTLCLPPGPLPVGIPPEECGDEALLLKRELPNIPLILTADRVHGAGIALREFAPDLLLLDDGFQHRRLRRDLDLLMIDGQRFFGNRRLLPAGPLRESLKGLERAGLVIINKADQPASDFTRELTAIIPRRPVRRIFFAGYRITAFRNAAGTFHLAPGELAGSTHLYAVAGLGNNDYFFDQLRALGLELKKTFSFPDHHRYTSADLVRLERKSRDGLLLTTAKDAVKLTRLTAADRDRALSERILETEIELQIHQKERFFALLDKLLAARCREYAVHPHCSCLTPARKAGEKSEKE